MTTDKQEDIHIDSIDSSDERYKPYKDWRYRLFDIIFHADTPAGKAFDIVLLILIIISALALMLDSIPAYHSRYWFQFDITEWIISILFSIEYITRILIIQNKKAYIFSFLGIVDLLSIVPFFLSIFFPQTEYFIMLRMLRLMRIFRVFNMMDYLNDSKFILKALKSGSRKIYIFLLFIIVITVLLGSVMYVVEKGTNGFDSIPQSIYWAVVTLTTVGYGDVSPITPLGKFISVILMLCGYAIIAVPTGILTSEMRSNAEVSKKECERCGEENNDIDARYCKTCGEKF